MGLLAPARPAALVLVLVLHATIVGADTVTGSTGTNGTAGAPCQPGTPGGDGGDATSGTPGPFAQSTAIGGNGGTGGAGGSCPSGNGGNGGTGGAGGDASAQATGVDASATAVGGSGGAGGVGGTGGSGFAGGTAGDGGDGGSATATATGSRSADVTVYGGTGGNASGAGSRAGDGGTATATGQVSSTTSGFVYLTVYGGQGGQGLQGASAGDGASVSLVNAASATGTTVSVQQTAIGGNGGYAAPGGVGGSPGSASSVLDLTNPLGSLSLYSRAEGGDSSSGELAGGAAYAAGTGTARDSVNVAVTALAGRSSETTQAGAVGAAATLGPVRGVSTGGGAVTVFGSVIGGEGGDSSTLAGDGADIVLDDAVDGETTGSLQLIQLSAGGRGGSVDYPDTGSAGMGGDARSALDRTKNASLLTLEALALGGASGTTGTAAPPVQGGSAEVDVRGRNESGDLVVLYRAIGGEGSRASSFNTTATGGRGGDAVGSARAVTTGNGNSIRIAPSEFYDYDTPYNGLYGVFGGEGGDSDHQGGTGGTGTAMVEGIAEGNSEVDVRAVAGGGVGGNGDSSNGVAGAGGAASATATGRNAGTSAVRVTAEALGGRGAYYGITGGDGGTATASARGESTGGANLTVTARATGGEGGNDSTGTGGSVDLLDAVSGATTGTLRLVQEARGGYSSHGRGGDAASNLTWSDSDGGRLELDVLAVAGLSGYSEFGVAHAQARGIGMAGVNVLARAKGSEGSSLGPVFGQSLGAGLVHVEGELTGYGGTIGEHGADVIVEDAVDGATGGTLELVQRAIGGASGATAGGGAPARGGLAVSRLTRSVTSAILVGRVEALGGAGAQQSSDFFGGLQLPSGGGDARSESAITNDGGAVSAFVSAKGGAGGDAYVPTSGANGGDASIHAEAHSIGDGHDVVVGGDSSYGAVGGDGGVSRSSIGPRGPAGAGGNAESTSIGTAAGNSQVTVRDRATSGAGLASGFAVSHAEGHNQGSARVSVLAEAIGGAGYFPNGTGGQAVASARGTSTTGDVDVTAVQTSGTTGGGIGLGSDATDAVSGATAGKLTLTQRAIAASGDTGGAASSSLAASNEGGGGLVIVSEAVAGSGGLPGGLGGVATASARGIGAGVSSVDVTARARGGDGATTFTYPGNELGGNGAVAALGEVSGYSDLGGSVRVRGEVYAGNGGRNGGVGANAVLANAVTGSTSGVLVLEQFAQAGSGARSGSANSSLEFSTASVSLELHSEARGGTVFPDVSVISPEPSGNATAIVRGENSAGAVSVYARADEWLNYPGMLFIPPVENGGAGGAASVSAFARSLGDGHDVTIGALPTATGTPRNGAFGARGSDHESLLAGGGGNGGSAASGSEGIAEGNSVVRVFDLATGGGGGSSTRGDAYGGNGTGGRGGDASSAASGRNAGAADVEVRADAIGGYGGGGQFVGGDGGIASAAASGTSDGGGNVSVTAVQVGGAGGSTSRLFESPPPTQQAGRGADSILRDAVRGSTEGRLTLVQRAVGGNGGSGGSSPGGAGGSATSELVATNAKGGDLTAVAEATGGDGGAGFTGASGATGPAHASVDAEGSAAVSATARAVGGAGAPGYSYVPDDGGTATLGVVTARSTGGGNVVVTGEATGGAGGSSRTGGGNGASVLLDNAVSGDTSGSLALVQRAIGGNGGSAGGFSYPGSGSAGLAGSATSRIARVARSTQFSVTNYAAGGDSAESATTGFLDSGSAEAIVDAVNESGGLNVIGRAEGGDVRGTSVAGAGGDASVSVVARTLGDGQAIRVGQAFATNPRLSVMGAIGGSGGGTSADHGGGGNASSSSSAFARGDSSVDVFDLAMAGSPTQGSPYNRLTGGDASSFASAISAGSSRALASSLAIGGTGYERSGDATSRAHAEGLGEVQSSAQARVSFLSLFSASSNNFATADARGIGSTGLASATATSSEFITAQGFASAGVLSDASASARSGGGALLTSAALATAVDAAAIVSPGSTQGNYWGSAALALRDLQFHEGTDVVLHSEAVFSGSTTASALTAGVYVSFLSLDFDPAGFGQLVFRVTNGTTPILEQGFDDAASVLEFFSHDLLLSGLTSTSSRVPGLFDLHLGLDLTSDAAGTGFGTVFAIGTGYVPEPDTGTLVVLGLVVLIAYRRTAATA